MVRSMLENAEEDVPSRVWASVEREIGVTRTVPFRRMAAYAASAAAAVVAGVFVGMRFFADSDKANSTFENIELVAGVPYAEDNGLSELDLASETSIISNSSLLAYVAPDTTPAPVSVTPSEPEYAAERQDDGPQASVPAEEIRTPVRETKAAEAEPEARSVGEDDAADPFAMMAYEDSRRKKPARVSFTAGGDMQTNANPAGSTRLHRWNVSSAGSPATTTVTQTSTNSTYSVPLSLGLKARIGFGGKWSLGTGLTWSMMERTFTGVYQEASDGMIINTFNSDIHNTLHYIGIPLNIYYDVVSGSRVNFYVFAGGSAEKLVSNKYRLAGRNDVNCSGFVTKNLQYSVAAGMGVQFKVNDLFGIYLDPSFRYFFDCGQPVSIRTQQPFSMSFEVGARFNL